MLKILSKSQHEIHTASRSSGTDLRDIRSFQDLIESSKPETVINCAAHVGGIQYGLAHEAEIYSDNLAINLNLYRLATYFDFRTLNPISNCVYPKHLSKFREEDLWSGPLDSSVATYGAIRRLTIVGSNSYWNQFQASSMNLIFPNLYGEGDHLDPIRAHALGAMVLRILEAKRYNKKTVEVWGTGRPIREWLHVEDAAKYLIESLSLSWTCETYNVGCGKGISILDLARMIKDIVGFEGEIKLNPELPDGAPCKIMDSSKSDNVFKIKPTVGLETGIQRTVTWYKKQMELD